MKITIVDETKTFNKKFLKQTQKELSNILNSKSKKRKEVNKMNERIFTEEEKIKIAKEQGRNPSIFEPAEYVCPECGKIQILDKWEINIIESELVNSRYLCNDCFKKSKERS